MPSAGKSSADGEQNTGCWKVPGTPFVDALTLYRRSLPSVPGTRPSASPTSRKISRTNQIRDAIVVEEEFRPRTLGCKPRLIYHGENCKNWSYFIPSDTLRASSHFEENSIGLYFRGIRSEATVASLRFSNNETRIDILLCWSDAGFFSRQHFAKDLSFHFSHPPWMNCSCQIRLTSGTHIEEHNYGRGSSAMSVVISLVFLVWLMNRLRVAILSTDQTGFLRVDHFKRKTGVDL